MNVLGVVGNSVIPVFLVILLGIAFGRKGMFQIRQFVDYIIYIAMPALIVHALSLHQLALEPMLMTGLGTLFVVGFVGGLALIYRAVTRDRGRDVLIVAMFANAANLPLPLAQFTFGDAGLGYQIIYMAVNTVLLYSLGVGIATGGGWSGIKQLLKLPLLYASALGMVLSVTGTELPVMLGRPIALVGNTAIPLLLFSLGYKIGTMKATTLLGALPLVALRVLGGAAAGLSFVWLFTPPDFVAQAVLLGCAMPSAVQSFMLVEKFTETSERAAAAVFLSTLFGFAYIPFVVGWLV